MYPPIDSQLSYFQSLDLSQIEAIVAEIEREKEAGTSMWYHSQYKLLMKCNRADRGGTKTDAAGRHSSRSGRDVLSCGWGLDVVDPLLQNVFSTSITFESRQS